MQAKSSRHEPARRRAALAKAALGAAGTVVFGVGMLFARAYYAGHPKHRLRALAPPQRFVSIVRANQLEAGIIAPAQAPPGAATAGS
jgi:hypothetical protein